jgi:hypothetical protein
VHPVALLIVGAIFVFIAMRAELPNRLKMGENEAAWEAVQNYVEQTVADASPDESAEEIGRVNELSSVAPWATGPALERVAYEQYAERAKGFRRQLEHLATTAPVLMVTRTRVPDRTIPDRY